MYFLAIVKGQYIIFREKHETKFSQNNTTNFSVIYLYLKL